jgi:hypothetical protein
MIITAGRQGEQLHWSELRTRLSDAQAKARRSPAVRRWFTGHLLLAGHLLDVEALL